MSDDEPPGSFKAELERVIDARNSFFRAVWDSRWELGIPLVSFYLLVVGFAFWVMWH